MTISPGTAGLIDEIRDDRVHGASELARRAVTVLKTDAELSRSATVEQFLQEQREVAERLMSVRPAMAPLHNIVSRYLNAFSTPTTGHDLDSLRRVAVTTADKIVQESLDAVQRIARLGSTLVSDGDCVMTHSYSSTVVAALKESLACHRNLTVIVTRSGPGRTGERTVQELAEYAESVTFIDDTAMNSYMSLVGRVLVGADRITGDGKLVNGIGTSLLALSARQANVPLYVLCETLKFDHSMTGAQVVLEEKDAGEVAAPGSLPPHVTIRNPYFDITPLELVTAVVTENEILKPEEVAKCMRRLAEGS